MPEKKPSARAPRSTGSRPRSTRKPTAAELESDADEPVSSRPVAVSRQAAPIGDEPSDEPRGALVGDEPAEPAPSDGIELAQPAEPEPAVSFDEPQPVERPGIELLVGVAGLLMALGTLLFSWYDRGPFLGKVKGIASGDLGPVVFFLGLAAAAIVGLRAMRKPIVFPLETPWILEGIGWLSVALLFIKRVLLKPTAADPDTTGWLIAFVPAVALALLGGYTSTHAPFVVKPGWQRSRAGKLGAGILIVAVLGGLIVGFTVKPAEPKRATAPVSVKGTPACGKTFPKPAGLTPVTGTTADFPPNGELCSMTLSSTLTPAQVFSRYDAAFKKAKWTYTVPQRGTSKLPSWKIQISKPVCGTVTIQNVAKGSSVTALTAPCAVFGSR